MTQRDELGEKFLEEALTEAGGTQKASRCGVGEDRMSRILPEDGESVSKWWRMKQWKKLLQSLSGASRSGGGANLPPRPGTCGYHREQ